MCAAACSEWIHPARDETGQEQEQEQGNGNGNGNGNVTSSTRCEEARRLLHGPIKLRGHRICFRQRCLKTFSSHAALNHEGGLLAPFHQGRPRVGIIKLLPSPAGACWHAALQGGCAGLGGRGGGGGEK